MKRCIIIAAWSVALALPAFAQNPPLQTPTLVLEATIPGVPALDFVVRNQVAARDFNDDGVPDVSLVSERDAATPKLEIVDGTDFENRWIFELVEALGSEIIVHLFIDLDPADGLKSILLAERLGQRYVNPSIIDAEGSLLWDGSGRALLAIGEGVERVERIVVFNPQVPQVEIWGVENN